MWVKRSAKLPPWSKETAVKIEPGLENTWGPCGERRDRKLVLKYEVDNRRRQQDRARCEKPL